MKVCGFSFIRNAIKYDYPVVEAISSILPVCDKFIVAVGNSEDNTRELIENIDKDKIIIIDTIWEESLREGGRVLALETDKAFQSIPEDFDWCFYIQGDEVVHEKYLDNIYKSMLEYIDNKNIEGLLFKYLHFYGSYDYVGTSYRWYRNEIRIIRNEKTIFSYRDAQGFRKKPDSKLKVKPIDAYIYHYGWVKDPRAMQKKQVDFNKLWHDDEWIEKNIAKVSEFDYTGIDSLEKFNDTHPKVMQNRIQKINWKFDHDPSFNKISTKDKIKKLFEKLGLNIGQYQNYKIVK
ncbi:MAG: hypothetical protein WHW07_06995 [Bacteroidales bacterium]|jgi:hypothetical protein